MRKNTVLYIFSTIILVAACAVSFLAGRASAPKEKVRPAVNQGVVTTTAPSETEPPVTTVTTAETELPVTASPAVTSNGAVATEEISYFSVQLRPSGGATQSPEETIAYTTVTYYDPEGLCALHAYLTDVEYDYVYGRHCFVFKTSGNPQEELDGKILHVPYWAIKSCKSAYDGQEIHNLGYGDKVTLVRYGDTDTLVGIKEWDIIVDDIVPPLE